MRPLRSEVSSAQLVRNCAARAPALRSKPQVARVRSPFFTEWTTSKLARLMHRRGALSQLHGGLPIMFGAQSDMENREEMLKITCTPF